MKEHHLAQFNVGHQIAPLDAPEMAEFLSLFEPLNALADESPGFLWRLTDGDSDDATGIRPCGDDVIINMSVWESREALWDYAYKSRHLEVLRRRLEWMHRGTESDPAKPCSHPHLMDTRLVLWWVPAGHIPTVEEAMDRMETLRKDGPGPEAFTFREPFEPPVRRVADRLQVGVVGEL